MKATGIVRKADALGRIVLPKEVRKTLGIDSGDSLEIFINETQIILRKYRRSCIFCESADGVFSFKGRVICATCYREIKK